MHFAQRVGLHWGLANPHVIGMFSLPHSGFSFNVHTSYVFRVSVCMYRIPTGYMNSYIAPYPTSVLNRKSATSTMRVVVTAQIWKVYFGPKGYNIILYNVFHISIPEHVGCRICVTFPVLGSRSHPDILPLLIEFKSYTHT